MILITLLIGWPALALSRPAVAVRTPGRELPVGDVEDGGRSPDFLKTETPLPTATVTFGATHGQGVRPVHQFIELPLAPPFTMVQDTDVDADDGGFLGRDLVGAAALSGRPASVSLARIA